MNPTAALFDIDGTLADSNFLHVEAWAHAFQDLRLGVPSWRIQRAIGADSSELLRMLIGDEPAATKDEASALHSHYYHGLQERIETFAGARELVSDLASRGIRVILATSAPADELEVLLGKLDIDEHVYATTSAEDVETAKPEPQLVELAVARAKVPPADAVFIGDSIWDIKAASRAGVAAIGLLSGGTDRESLRREGAIEVYEDVAELHNHLDDPALARFFSDSRA